MQVAWLPRRLKKRGHVIVYSSSILAGVGVGVFPNLLCFLDGWPGFFGGLAGQYNGMAGGLGASYGLASCVLVRWDW